MPGPQTARLQDPRPLPARRALAAAALSAAALAGAAAPALALPVAGIAASAVVAAPQAAAVEWQDVELVDEAGVVDPERLRRGLAEVEFREPTRVAVVTERGPDLSGLDDDRASQAFNGRVLERARAEHPDWLSADGQTWADGLVIVALDPDNRMLGLYVGEDRSLSTDQLQDVREDGYEAARAAKWTDALVDVTDSAAELIGRPWWQHPGLWIGAGAVGLVGAGTGAAVMADRRKKRGRTQADLEAARGHLTAVTLELDATEVNASTVPTDSPHAATLLERFRGFRERTLDATAEQQRLEAVPEKDLHRREHREAAAALRAQTAELDGLDDAIGAANALLNRHPGWPAAWDLQTAPLREDLDAVAELRDAVTDTPSVQAAVAALESFRAEASGRLDALSGDLEAERVTPAAALDELDGLRGRLTSLVGSVAEAEITAFSDDDEERRILREKLRSRRGTHRAARGSILDCTLPSDAFWTVVAFNAGHRAGERSVQERREAASSSSSSGTGYGSSGGSFSGTGSSGRF